MRHHLALAATLVSVAAGCGPDLDHPGVAMAPEVEGQALCPGGSILQGVDVSGYQGTINWSQAKGAGIVWAYAKATEGTGFQDSSFSGNWSGMQSAGVIRGAYHFFHPDLNGTQQADYFLAYVGAIGAGDLPPMLDWEVTDGVSGSTAGTNAQAFIAEIKAKTGRQTVVYTSPGLWGGFGVPQSFGSDPLWVADWTYATSSCPTLPSGWGSFVFWQWSDGKYGTGSVAGIPTTVDRDVFNGTLSQLQSFANTQAALPVGQQSGNDAVTVVNWPDQHVELFARTPAGDEEHVWTTGSNDTWSGPELLDKGAECGSAASFWGDPWTYPELFSPLANGSTGHLWWTAGKNWNTYQPYGGSKLSHLATLVWLDGRTEVFALGSDHAIWHDSWDTAATSWSGWQSLGGDFATGPGTILWGNGTGELFAVDAAGDVWHSWSGSGSSYPNGWYAWTKFGSGMASRPAPVRWPDGHAEVFVRGIDGQLYHSNFDAKTGWPAFTAVSAGSHVIGDPSAIMDDGKGGGTGPEVFARDESGQVVHLWWGGSSYGSFAPLGTLVSASDPFGWIRGDGAAEVFAIDGSGSLARNYRDPAKSWQGWSAIGAGFDPCAAALPPPADAGAPAPDAGEPDAGPPPPPHEDAGVADAGRGEDAGQTVADDGGLTLPGREDGGAPPNVLAAKGCGCGTTGPADLPLVLLAALGLAARRRRR